MKKNLLIIAIALLSLGGVAQENETATKTNLLSFSIPRLFMNNFSVQYERILSDHTSMAISGGIILKENRGDSRIGGNGEFQFRMYPAIMREKVFQGVYFAPYANYRYVDIEESYYYYHYYPEPAEEVDRRHEYYSTLGGGIVVGAKIAIMQRVVFSFEVGGGMRYSTGTKEDGRYYDITDYGFTGIAPRADIGLGFFF